MLTQHFPLVIPAARTQNLTINEPNDTSADFCRLMLSREEGLLPIFYGCTALSEVFALTEAPLSPRS